MQRDPSRRAASIARRLRPGALALLAGLAACAVPAPSKPVADATALPCTPPLTFLEDGRTSRAEAVALLGTPSSRWEKDRIFVYAVVRDAHGGFHVAWSGPGATLRRSHDLVLVFDVAGRLARHALVPKEDP